MPATDRERKLRLQYELQRRGITQRQIAEQLDLSEATVSKVFSGTYPEGTDEGRRTRARVEDYTAALLGTEPAEFFPPREAAEV